MDMQWYEEARTAITAYRQGVAARKQADATQAQLRSS